LLDLFRIHGYYIFCIGTFHGDIHPGNIIWHEDRFWFIDTGVISTVSRRLAHGLFGFFEALSAWDYPASAAALNRMAERGIEGERFLRFEKKFLELYADFRGKTVSQVSLTRRMMETIRLGVLSGMQFERGMYPVIKSMMYLDGMVLRANPQAVLLPDMRRFIAEFAPFLPEDQGRAVQ
jgi:ubiquinone biosynthesis protein